LAARNEKQARRGTIFAAYLKLLPFFIFIIPGIIAYALSKTGQLTLQEADQAFPTLVKTLLPTGIRGLVAGGLLAALMSSLAAVFNSCSTLFTIDIYKKLKPDSSEKTLVRVGRIATGAVVISGVLWIPFMKYISGELYHYLQSVQAYIAPPIAAVFLLGLFFKRINAQGALTAMVSGFVLGMGRLVLEINKENLSGWLYKFASINFLHFCIFLFLFCIILMIVVSLLSPAPSDEKIKGLTYATTVATDKAASRASWNYKDIILSIAILIMLGMILVYFSRLFFS
jgi:SSS family solute:Na+ symporter